jgi:hypothetical protein
MSGQAVFLGCLAYTAGRFRQRAAFTLSSALCYICIIYATRLVQHLETSLEESMSVRNSEVTTHLNVHQLLRTYSIESELTTIVQTQYRTKITG